MLKNKKGDISFEALMITSFVLMALMIIGASVFFFYNRDQINSNQNNTVVAYNDLITCIRLDSHLAVVAATENNSLTLLDKDVNTISIYSVKEGNLIRADKNKERVLYAGVEGFVAYTSADLPNLLTVRLYPADKQKMPFFTSFALRGLNNDMQ